MVNERKEIKMRIEIQKSWIIKNKLQKREMEEKSEKLTMKKKWWKNIAS